MGEGAPEAFVVPLAEGLTAGRMMERGAILSGPQRAAARNSRSAAMNSG